MSFRKPTTITPFLTVRNAAKALEFYINAFNAQVLEQHDLPNKKLTAKISVDGADLFFGDEEPEFDNVSPTAIGASPVRIILIVDDPDTVFAKALKAGAIQICPVTTEETWRIGKLKDPFGHIWEVGKEL